MTEPAEIADEELRRTWADIADRAGISYKRCDHWTRLGYLHPEGGNGSGDPRHWPDEEVEVARRMGRLADAGLALEWCAQFARDGWPSGELAPGITVVVSEERAASTPRLALADYGRLYLREGHRAHLSPPYGKTSAGEALCPVMPAWPDEWLGTGSQAEYEKAASLPVCRACMARFALASVQFGGGDG